MKERKNKYYKVANKQDLPDYHGTPVEVFNQLDAAYGFTIDAYACEQSALCAKYFTEETDALKQDWGEEVVFCAPPSLNLKVYVKDAYEKAQKGATVVMLIPARTDTIAFRDYIRKGYVRYIRGRIQFNLNGEPQKDKSPYPSMIVEFTKYTQPRHRIVEIGDLNLPIDVQPILVNTKTEHGFIFRDISDLMKYVGSEFPGTMEEVIDQLRDRKSDRFGVYEISDMDRHRELSIREIDLEYAD